MLAALPHPLVVLDAEGRVTASHGRPCARMRAGAPCTCPSLAAMTESPAQATALRIAAAHARGGDPVDEIVTSSAAGQSCTCRVALAAAGADGALALTFHDETAAAAQLAHSAAIQRTLTSVDVHLYSGELHPDGTFRETFSGPGLDTLLGGEPTCAPGEAWDAAVHEEDRYAFEGVVERLREGRAADAEYRLVGLDGRTRWVRDRVAVRNVRADGVVEIDGIASDISYERGLSDELELALAESNELNLELDLARSEADRLARTDGLTGLTNRRFFTETAIEALTAVGPGLGILMVDCDHFKRVNDTLGHHAGDQVLIEVARRLEECARTGDAVARWGGEEFIVLARGIDDDEALRAAGRRFHGAITASPVRLDDGTDLPVTASIGCARTQHEVALEHLVDEADRALYAAKRRGRDRALISADLTARDLEAEEPESIRLAHGLGIVAGIRSGGPDLAADHVERVARSLAETLELDRPTTLATRIAALLNSLGHIALPDAVLDGAARGDHEARLAVRAHAPIGATLAARIPALAGAVPGVRHQLERWDGRGFPDGLAGEAIPLEARVVAVATAYVRHLDHVDEPARALDRVRRDAGTAFDPAIVEALVATISPRRVSAQLAA